MSLTGKLDIALTLAGDRVAGVAFSGLRRLPLDRLLTGKLAEDAPALIGALFALCGHAQRACAATAIAAATGVETASAERRERDRLVVSEALREHGVRMAADWPAFVDAAPDQDAVAAFHRGVRDVFAAPDTPPADMIDALARLLFGQGEADFEVFSDARRVFAWARNGSTPAGRLVARLLDDPGESDAFPEESGTPLARQAYNAVVGTVREASGELAARLVARIVETIALARRLTADDPGPAIVGGVDEDGGFARADVARGTLAHHARVADGRIVGYRIDAPTSVNFAPGGPAERALLRLSGQPEDLDWRARLTALELDPCVAFSLRVF